MPRVAESIGLTSTIVYRQRATPIRETMSMTVRSESSTVQRVALSHRGIEVTASSHSNVTAQSTP